jgi:hypothetical protein
MVARLIDPATKGEMKMLKSKSALLGAILASLGGFAEATPTNRAPNIHESASMQARRKSKPGAGDKLWRKARKGRLGMATLR